MDIHRPGTGLALGIRKAGTICLLAHKKDGPGRGLVYLITLER